MSNPCLLLHFYKPFLSSFLHDASNPAENLLIGPSLPLIFSTILQLRISCQMKIFEKPCLHNQWLASVQYYSGSFYILQLPKVMPLPEIRFHSSYKFHLLPPGHTMCLTCFAL